MSDRRKKVSELTTYGNTSISNTDLFIITDVSANSTKSATFNDVRRDLFPGPYADDAAANTAGVAVGFPYYNTSGDVKIRLS